MNHQMGQLLSLNKKARSLPIQLFYYFASSLAMLVALYSYGNPAYSHHTKFSDRDIVNNLRFRQIYNLLGPVDIIIP